MAIDRKCDKCGKPSASEVRVDIILMDVVAQGQPTGISFVTDACPNCRADEADRLFRAAFAQLTRDIPRHKELLALKDEENGLTAELKKAVTARDGIEKKDSPEYRKAQVEVDRIQGLIDKKQERRAYVLDDKNY
jgi:hypothetical protein